MEAMQMDLQDVMARVCELADMEFVEEEREQLMMMPPVIEGPSSEKLLGLMANIALNAGPDAFCQFVAEEYTFVMDRAYADDLVAEMLILCYRIGIAVGHGDSANDLGAIYYKGDLVDQDYEEAKHLYTVGMELGSLQAIINLGYIYEYGRTGEPDHKKAFELYALANALCPNCEAVYKLGDCYSRGKAVEQDMKQAMRLWERSLRLAEDDFVQKAQPAVRIAKQLLAEQEHAIPFDWDKCLRALRLFQEAEVGLQYDIEKNEMTYYRKRLEEAIKGQERARELLNTRFDL